MSFRRSTSALLPRNCSSLLPFYSVLPNAAAFARCPFAARFPFLSPPWFLLSRSRLVSVLSPRKPLGFFYLRKLLRLRIVLPRFGFCLLSRTRSLCLLCGRRSVSLLYVGSADSKRVTHQMPAATILAQKACRVEAAGDRMPIPVSLLVAWHLGSCPPQSTASSRGRRV